MTYIIHETIDALNSAFKEFKSTNDDRLAALEKKGAVDPILEEKVNRLNQFLDQTSDRLGRLEVVSRRPALGETKTSERDSAFSGYVCKGIETELERKSLSSTDDASGGYLIPREMEDEIQAVAQNLSPLRALSRVTRISSDALEMLIEKGEASVGWVAETGEREETDTPELVKLKIPVHQLYAKPRASQKLLDDSKINVESWLAEKIADKMISFENAAFVNGSGEGQPMGFLSYGNVVGKAEWGKFEAIPTHVDGGIRDGDVLFDALYALKAKYLPGACWIMSRSALAAIRKLKDKQGGYLWQPGLIVGTPGVLLGHPVYVADDMPPLVSDEVSISAAFGNFQAGYQIVDRAGIHVLRDPYCSKPYVEFYTTKRVGGDVINFDAIKLISFNKD